MAMNDLFKQKKSILFRSGEDEKRKIGGWPGRFVSQLMVAGVIFVLLLFCYQKDNAAGEAVRQVVAMATADQSESLAVSGLPFWQGVPDDVNTSTDPAPVDGKEQNTGEDSQTNSQQNQSEIDETIGDLDTSAAYTTSPSSDGTIDLVLPVSGVLTLSFGEVSPAGVNCNGLVINCENQQNVKAAAAGTVISVGGSAGNYNMRIEHSADTVTVYDGLSELKVQKGTALRQGDEIGSVAAGVELHFAVLKSGTPVDPLNYLESPTAN